MPTGSFLTNGAVYGFMAKGVYGCLLLRAFDWIQPAF
jgi:hypothetical protein